MSAESGEGSGESQPRSWIFLTNHAHVLLQVAHRPDATVREIAARVGITERAAHRILADLVAERYIERERVGRRNRYRVDPSRPLRHAQLSHLQVGALLSALGRDG